MITAPLPFLTANDTGNIFDELAPDYWLSDYLSFGITNRLRSIALQQLDIKPGETVCDAMCGTGNNFDQILSRNGKVIGIEYADKMVRLATGHAHASQVTILQENFLQTSLPDHSVDKLICTFGLKSMPVADFPALASQLKRILVPGGSYAFAEIDLCSSFIKRPALFYIRYLMPLLNRCITSHNPHRYLYQFASRELDTSAITAALLKSALSVDIKRAAFGQGIIIAGRAI